MLLQTMLEQFIASSDNIMVEFEMACSGGIYHYINTEYGVTMTVITDAPFNYTTQELLIMLKAKCVKLVKISFTKYGG